MTKTPLEVVTAVLADTANPELVKELVADDATYVNLNYESRQLAQILPWAGTSTGPDAFIDTAHRVFSYWQAVDFEIKQTFAGDEDVAIFGSFTHQSNALGKEVTSPFAVWAKVKAGKIIFLQYLEDSFATADSVRAGGTWRIHVDPEGKPFEA